jgi:hypothetical protein
LEVEEVALVGQEQDEGRPDGTQPHHEHHQVLDFVAGMQFFEGINYRPPE